MWVSREKLDLGTSRPWVEGYGYIATHILHSLDMRCNMLYSHNHFSNFFVAFNMCSFSGVVVYMVTGESASPSERLAKAARTDSDQLTSLKQMTMVVADTGDYSKIKQFRPQDATTNPSLILQAVQSSEHRTLITSVISECQSRGHEGSELVTEICDNLAVRFGIEILNVVPGRVSTEVDASLSFDTSATIEKAKKLIRLYESNGIDRARVLIKIASTWEGIRACQELEKIGIHTNMTLIFNYYQAIACAQAGATLISPFVGRILDWFVKNAPHEVPYTKLTDPGVVSVTRIYKYFKCHQHTTTVMGASFRSKEQILGLAGIDALTISPKLLDELESAKEPLERVLSPITGDKDIQYIEVDENTFRWYMNEDAMATEKLAEGIRNFNADYEKLKRIIRSMI
jgi:transaldolase